MQNIVIKKDDISLVYPSLNCQNHLSKICHAWTKGVFTWENSHQREFHTGMISYHTYMMTGFFHHPTSTVLKLTEPSWIDKNYACATRSSLPANRFHTETSGRFAFTWYSYEISYRKEILAPVREPGWTHAGATRVGMTFCGGIM